MWVRFIAVPYLCVPAKRPSRNQIVLVLVLEKSGFSQGSRTTGNCFLEGTGFAAQTSKTRRGRRRVRERKILPLSFPALTALLHVALQPTENLWPAFVGFARGWT